MNLLTQKNSPGTPPAPKNGPSKIHVLVGAAVIIVFLLLVGGVYWIQGAVSKTFRNTLHPQNVGFLESVKNFVFPSTVHFDGEDSDRVNILILGVGGPGHDGPYLSDTNILFSFQPSTKEVALISIPRDLGVKIDGHGIRKINSADAFGEAAQPGSGGDYAREIFSPTFNIPIPYYIRLDFTAFIEIINAVGGVTVDVPTTFTDTAFPESDTSFAYRTIHFDKGPQTMNGPRALDYARSRHGNNGEGSDFGRSHRQQLILVALKEKLLSLGTYTDPTLIEKMITTLSKHVVTNLTIGQVVYLAALAREINGPPKNLVLDNSRNGYLVSATGDSGAFLLFPKTGDFTSINSAIAEIFNPNFQPTPTVVSRVTTTSLASAITKNTGPIRLTGVKIEIQNGTWRVGLAGRIKQVLDTEGYTIINIGNSIKRPIAQSAVYVLNSKIDPAYLKKISAAVHTPLATVVPDWLHETYDDPATADDETGMKYNKDADVLVVLGDDTIK